MRIAVLALALSLSSLPAAAQTPTPASPALDVSPTGDLSVGYGPVVWLHSDFVESTATLPLGWVVSGSARATPMIAIVGEASGSYKHETLFGTDFNSDAHTFAGGVRILSASSGPSVGFVQFLAGTVHLGTGSAIGGSAGAWLWLVQVGGGVDIQITRLAAFRAQVDVQTYTKDHATQFAVRPSFGIAFRFF